MVDCPLLLLFWVVFTVQKLAALEVLVNEL